MEPPFAIVGYVPDVWAEDLYAFAEHPWGWRGLERLVVGDVDASLGEWLPEADYEGWRATRTFAA